MPDTNYLDIMLLGKEYRVACPPDERTALLHAASYVDGKMHDIAGKTRNNVSERVAVMAALNIAHEFLSAQAGKPVADGDALTLDIGAIKRRISDMEAQLDSLLEPQEKLI